MTETEIENLIREKEDINTDLYDGCYLLFQRTIEEYKTVDMQEIDCKDLDCIYSMVIGTWKISFKKKKENVEKSNLRDESKAKLLKLIDEVETKVNEGFYQNKENGKSCAGMFGTGFLTFSKTSNEDAKKFILLCVALSDETDESCMLDIAERVLSEKNNGLGTATISEMLHCLKPYCFPILNNNVEDFLYDKVGVQLDSRRDPTKYIENVRRIKEYRDCNFKFRNYRVFDLVESEISNKKVNYWAWNHTWENASNNDIQSLITDTIKSNYCKMQYEYDFQNNSSVSRNWKNAMNLREGDIVFLRGKNKFYAYGRVVKPRRKADITLKMSDIIRKKNHEFDGINYRSDSYKGIICFSDSDVFYENLEGESEWGQRIDVDSWRCYCRDGIDCSSDIYNNSNLYDAIRPIKENSAMKYMKDLEATFMQEERKYIALLEEHKNLIFHGAPGTGKTYLAKKIAMAKILNKRPNEIGDSDNELLDRYCKFVQFHPSYDYTDFVEGIKPVSIDSNGNIIFARIDGTFKNFCKKAVKEPEKPFYFIIDEINRGELSKIFGELFFSIEPSYRGKEYYKVETQFQKLINADDEDFFKYGFYVPDNVYIIGTMNDIDRSVDTMDFAMRRRFVFVEITAEQSAINMGLAERSQDGEIINETDAYKRMKNLNAAIISGEIPELNESYCIGAQYFLNKEGKPVQDFETLWDLKLKGLLTEYLRGTSNINESLMMLHDAYDLRKQYANGK